MSYGYISHGQMLHFLKWQLIFHKVLRLSAFQSMWNTHSTHWTREKNDHSPPSGDDSRLLRELGWSKDDGRGKTANKCKRGFFFFFYLYGEDEGGSEMKVTVLLNVVLFEQIHISESMLAEIECASAVQVLEMFTNDRGSTVVKIHSISLHFINQRIPNIALKISYWRRSELWIDVLQ